MEIQSNDSTSKESSFIENNFYTPSESIESDKINHHDNSNNIEEHNAMTNDYNEINVNIDVQTVNQEINKNLNHLISIGGPFEDENITSLYLNLIHRNPNLDPFYISMRILNHEMNSSNSRIFDISDIVSNGIYIDWRKFLLNKSNDFKSSSNNLLVDFQREQHLSNSQNKDSSLIQDHTLDSNIDDLSFQKATEETTEDDISETDSMVSNHIPKYLDPNTVQEAYSFVGIHHLFEDKGQILRLKFANFEMSKVAWSTSLGIITIAQLDGESPRKVFTLKGHRKEIIDFDWSMTNDYIVSVSLDKTLRIWDAQLGKCIGNVDTQEAMSCCLFHPLNNNRILVGSYSSSNLIWYNTSTSLPQKKFKINNPVGTICFSPQGNLLLIGDVKGNLYTYTYDENTLNMKKRSMTTVNRAKTAITSISYSSYERFAKRPSNLILVNDTSNFVKLFSLDLDTFKISFKAQFPIQHSRLRVRSVFCPLISMRMGAVFVTGCESSGVKVFDLTKRSNSNNFLNELNAHTAPVLDVSWNYSETILGSCDANGTILFWKREKLNSDSS